MFEENLNQSDLPVAPLRSDSGQAPAETPLASSGQVGSTGEPAAPVVLPPPVLQPEVPQPVQISPPPVSPPMPASQPLPILHAGFVSQLMAKAKEKIQFRKRRKLEKIVALVSREGKITNDDVQKLLRVFDATATRYLSQLVKEGRLRRTGHPRDAKYEPAG